MQPTTRTTDSPARELALLGGAPACQIERPRFPVFTESAIQRVVEILRSGRTVGLSKSNEYIREAELTLAEWHGVNHCLTTISGHAALHAALIGLQVTGGDEVITSPYTWGSTISCILHNGAVPVFADVDPQTGLLDPDTIVEATTERTTAIMVPHIYGQPADMTRICQIAERRGLAVIEDGSQAHGAKHRGRRVGSFGDAAGFSCMGFKPLAATEAGFMLAKDQATYFTAAISTQHPHANDNPGRADEPGFPSDLEPFIDSLIYTYRQSPINAVLLVEQLKKLDDENAGRSANRETLLAATEGISSISFPDYGDDEAVYHFVTLNFNELHAGVTKETYVAALQAEGLPIFSYITRPLYRFLRLQPDSQAPRVVWDEPLRQSNVNFTSLERPGCEAKIAQSLEISWNYTVAHDHRISAMADAFVKVEEHLDDLRAYERDAA